MLDDGSAESARMLRELEDKEMALSDRSRRVAELEGMLRSREEAIDAIRRKVTDALTGFEGKGLSISIRNGNVYVSMDDKLLFRSGSFEIDPNGARAVRDLSEVLAQNPDINVMVEGHTDDVPYRSNGQLKDNLDLSAKRATTVVRLLENDEIAEPHHSRRAGRIASGRSGRGGEGQDPTYRISVTRSSASCNSIKQKSSPAGCKSARRSRSENGYRMQCPRRTKHHTNDKAGHADI